MHIYMREIKINNNEKNNTTLYSFFFQVVNNNKLLNIMNVFGSIAHLYCIEKSWCCVLWTMMVKVLN